MAESQLRLWHAQKITSILQDGLLPGSDLYSQRRLDLPSHDPGGLIIVCGVMILSPDYTREDLFLANVQDKLYRGPESVFPVLMERQQDPLYPTGYNAAITQRLARRLEKRMQASFVIMDRAARPIWERSRVPIEDFDVIFFPEGIWRDCQELIAPFVPPKTEVLIVDDMVERPIPGLGRSLWVPNYEERIASIVKADGVPAWVHGSRLPTREDLNKSRIDPDYRFPVLSNPIYAPFD